MKELDYLLQIYWQLWKDDVRAFFQDILTPQEIENIYERLQIIKLLKEWYSQREVSEKLGVSTSTVNRWARVLKYWSWIFNKLNL